MVHTPGMLGILFIFMLFFTLFYITLQLVKAVVHQSSGFINRHCHHHHHHQHRLRGSFMAQKLQYGEIEEVEQLTNEYGT